jgi:hypothetical protein
MILSTSLLIAGMLLLAYVVAALFMHPLSSFVIMLPAAFLFLLCISFNFVLYNARLGAWLGTLWRHDD